MCYNAPGLGLGSLGWEYGTYTWHTNRDTYDKVVPDELRNNAVLVAMLAYQASEEGDKLPRERRFPPADIPIPILGLYPLGHNHKCLGRLVLC